MHPVNIPAKFDVRSFTYSWDNRGYFKNLGSPWICPRSLFSQIFKGLLFTWTLWIYLPSLKFIALPIPEIIGGAQKIGAVPGYAHAPFSPKILKGFCSDDPVNIPAKFDVRSFIRSWDNRGYSDNLGSPCIPPRYIFSQIFNRLLFAWTIWTYPPNLTFVALPIPEIIGGTSKIGESLGTKKNSYLFDSHCLRYKHQATVQNAEIVGYIVRPLCTGKPIARLHLKTNRTVKCLAFLSSFGIKISHVSSFGSSPNRSMSSQGYRPKYSSVKHLYVVWRIV